MDSRLFCCGASWNGAHNGDHRNLWQSSGLNRGFGPFERTLCGNMVRVLNRSSSGLSVPLRKIEDLKMKIEIDITDQMPEIVEFIREQTEVDLDDKQITEFLSKESRLVADIDEWGWYDTEVRSRVVDMITDRFLGRRWPTYGEKMNIRAFINDLKKAAEGQGFSTLPSSDDASNGGDDAPPSGFDRVVAPLFASSSRSMSAVEVWAHATGGYDVALRSKVYTMLDGHTARSALATMFPEGSAFDEISRRVKERQDAGPGANNHAVSEAVIDDIATEVRTLGEELSKTSVSPALKSILEQRLSPSSPHPPFIVVFNHSGGREQLLIGGSTPDNDGNPEPRE